jgi:hypothetical protein
MVYKDLVVCTPDGEALPIGAKLDVLQTMPRISVICQSEQHETRMLKYRTEVGKRKTRSYHTCPQRSASETPR